MSMRRAAPGPQVSQGRVRVDAARAIRKLREYQLTDRAAWVLEAIRAAVAAGATKIELRGDANDIWVGWHGTPWDADLLPRLFDELVSPEVSDDKQHVRLLAAAVNSALGMNPAYVDVYTVTGAGQGKRVRYTPEVLAEPENELGEAPLRHVAVETAEPPTEIAAGVLVHLRRRASLAVLQYWIGEPPELPLARAACRDIAVPLVINEDLVLQRDARNDLVRVPLDDGLSGFVAITHELVAPAACFEVAERGVVLARYGLELLGFEAKVPTTVRVFLDAERLPTNASRSQVRRDVHPIATAERRAKEAVAKAIAQLAPLVTDGRADVAPKARAAALSLLAAAVGGHPVHWQHTPPVLAPLTTIPLVRNAFGEARPIHSAWTTHIHTEGSALDADLKPWLAEILWAPPDDAVHRLLADTVVQVATTRRHVRWARQQRRAHKKFLAHAKREVKVQTSVYPRARVSAGVMVERSCVPQDVFTDVTGEICVYTETRNGAVVLCVEGRELERVEFTSAIPFDAVLDSSRLAPGERYRGVRRDAGFTHVDRALRAGVVRAIETIAAENPRVLEVDMPLIQSALLLAKDLELSIDGPLTQAAIWRNAAGGYVSYADLLASQYIGLIGDEQTLVPPAGRMIVHVNGEGRDALRRLFGNRVVSYHKAVDKPRFDPLAFAIEMPSMSNSVSLAIADPHMPGVIAVAANSRFHLRHMNVGLGERPYNHELTPSLIVLNSDRFLPNEKWTGVLDDNGLATLSFRDWEIALLRAIASRLIGIEVPMLVTSAPIEFGDPAFEALATVLLEHDPAIILGTELYERFCEYPLFEKLGSSERHSVRALATANPQGLFYLTSREELPVDEFQPVIASERIALLLAKLSRRPVHDGKPELKARTRAYLGKQRLAALLAKPQEPIALTSDLPTFEFRGKLVRGFIGLTEDRPHVRVHVENRPFTTFEIQVGFPIVAAVELARGHCNVTLDGIPNLTQEEIIEDLREAVSGLIESIASTQPRLFGEPGPARRMLSAFLNTGRGSSVFRDLLRSMPAFATVQGEYRSIASVEDPPTFLMIAAYADEWFKPGEGDAPTVHDAPILRVARVADELNAIITKLHMNVVADVTTDVMRLQARRRMALGLLPTPKLTGIPDNLKRPLKAFGDLAQKLGHGEVGFAMSAQSSLLIHQQGMLNRTVDIDVAPAIQLAIESPHEAFDHAQITRIAQDLAIELVRTAVPFDVPIVMRRNLARAALGNRVPPAVLGQTPLFQRVDGSWIPWDRFSAQLEKFEDVWAVTTTVLTPPLDPERIVFQIDAADIELATKNGFKVINALFELECDAKARENMARPVAYRLEIPTQEGVLATVELDGDGKTSPRGKVAVLAPPFAVNRAMYAHREMRPFDKVEDVCRWPTIAVIDDARIEPDRTWSGPQSDDNWQAIVKAVRKASEEALAFVGDVPGAALAELRITSGVCSDVKALRDAPRSQIRGVLWLAAVPFTPVNVQFSWAGGTRSFVPDRGVAIGGTLAIYTEDQLDIGKALEQLCEIAHGKMVRMLLNDKDVERDLAAAHIAHALAINTVKPTEVNGIKFGCFAPNAVEPRQLASLLRRTDPVAIVKAGTKDIDSLAFVDDGSEVAKVVRVHFGDRLTRMAPTPKPKPAPPPPPARPPVSTERPAPHPARKPAPPKKPHVLQSLVDALSDRVAKLGIQTASWEIDESGDTMMSYEAGALFVVIGGKHALLRKVAAELASNSIHAVPAIDALAAHAVSLLNIARTDITDATEVHALGVLLATPPSAGRPRSPRS